MNRGVFEKIFLSFNLNSSICSFVSVCDDDVDSNSWWGVFIFLIIFLNLLIIKKINDKIFYALKIALVKSIIYI